MIFDSALQSSTLQSKLIGLLLTTDLIKSAMTMGLEGVEGGHKDKR